MKLWKCAALVCLMGAVLTCLYISLLYVFPKATWSISEGTSVDLGIHMVGSEATTDFTFANTGSDPLRVVVEKTSCGCTTLDWTETVLEPGQKRPLKLTIRVARLPGKFDATATIHLYQGRSESTAILQVAGQAREAVKTSFASLYFGELDYEELPATRSIVLTKGSIPGLTPNQITEISSSLPFVHLELTESTPERVTLAASIGDDAPLGTSQGDVKVSFALDYTNALYFPVYVNLRGPFSLSPDMLFFGQVNAGERYERACTIEGTKDINVISKPIVTGQLAKWLTADLEQRLGFSRVHASLRIDEELKDSAVADGCVEIEISEREKPGVYKLRIPARAIVPHR